MAPSRLSPKNLALVPQPQREQAERPAPGIVHLGVGAFFRAHVALYIQEAITATGGDWGVIGVSLRSPQQRDLLAPQDFLYTAIERDAGVARATIVNILREILVAPEGPAAVLERMARPSTRIVTLTVTEKGYCHDPANFLLNWEHPDIKHDLANPRAPRSAVGFIVEALRLRKENSVAPFTAITCDNLPKNGKLLEGLVCSYAERLDLELARWIASRAAFPSCMVDRIVPATTEKDIDDAARLTGLADAAPVTHEPYRQWVIEDRFVDNSRPAWERCGVEFVANVEPYENMKLRLLNASHSALAYLGYLSGYETIARIHRAALARGDNSGHADPARHGCQGLYRRVARPLCQHGYPSPHVADRDGWLAEAAAADPGNRACAPCRQPVHCASWARGRGLDSLCARCR